MAILLFAIWRPSAISNFRNLEFTVRHVTSIASIFHVQNFTEIGQSAAELWP